MKKFYSFIITLLILLPINVFSLDYPSINSKIVEVYDVNDDKVLYEVDSNKQTSIASLTKIATTITAIENIKNLDEQVTITSNILSTVSSDASKAGLKVGDKVTYRDLLYASMLPSGADATNSLAILISGSIDNYVVKMNELAKKIGLKNTHFVNVTGLDINDHYSTADDVRKLLNYALKNKLFREIYTAKEYTLSNGLKVTSTINSKYGKNQDVTTILGSKTGYTGNAGYCLSSLSNINGHEMLIIVLNASQIGSNYYNIVDTIDLINFMNDNYKEETLVKKGQLIKKIPVTLSKIDNYNILSTKDVKKYLPKDYDIKNLKIKYKGLNSLSFSNKKGEKIGTVKYYYEGKLINEEKVILNKEIKMDIIKVLKKYYYIIIGVIILIITLVVSKIKGKKKKKRKQKKMIKK